MRLYVVANQSIKYKMPIQGCYTIFQDCEPIDDEILSFESSPIASEQQLQQRKVVDTSISDHYFETVNCLARYHTGSHSPVDDNLGNDPNANDWIMEGNKPQALDYFTDPQSMLRIVEEQKNI